MTKRTQPYIWCACTFGALQPTANISKTEMKGYLFLEGTYLRVFTVFCGGGGNINGTECFFVGVCVSKHRGM